MRFLTMFATAAATNAAEADQPAGLVEDFSYPNADEILASTTSS